MSVNDILTIGLVLYVIARVTEVWLNVITKSKNLIRPTKGKEE